MDNKASNIFTEVGFGNRNFFSTEFEERNKEYRKDQLISPKKINGVYIRLRLFEKEFVLSTCDGLKLKRNKEGFKLLFGVEGS